MSQVGAYFTVEIHESAERDELMWTASYSEKSLAFRETANTNSIFCLMKIAETSGWFSSDFTDCAQRASAEPRLTIPGQQPRGLFLIGRSPLQLQRGQKGTSRGGVVVTITPETLCLDEDLLIVRVTKEASTYTIIYNALCTLPHELHDQPTGSKETRFLMNVTIFV